MNAIVPAMKARRLRLAKAASPAPLGRRLPRVKRARREAPDPLKSAAWRPCLTMSLGTRLPPSLPAPRFRGHPERLGLSDPVRRTWCPCQGRVPRARSSSVCLRRPGWSEDRGFVGGLLLLPNVTDAVPALRTTALHHDRCGNGRTSDQYLSSRSCVPPGARNLVTRWQRHV